MGSQRYLIALGSNVRHPRHGPPRAVLQAALHALDRAGLQVEAASRIVETAPLGPSRRRYANAAAIVRTDLEPEAMLRELQRIEHALGRRRTGQRWGARVLDLDIVLWSGGCWSSPGLTVPHALFRERSFVLGPALPIAGQWRDPVSNLTLRQLAARLTMPRRLPVD